MNNYNKDQTVRFRENLIYNAKINHNFITENCPNKCARIPGIYAINTLYRQNAGICGPKTIYSRIAFECDSIIATIIFITF